MSRWYKTDKTTKGERQVIRERIHAALLGDEVLKRIMNDLITEGHDPTFVRHVVANVINMTFVPYGEIK